MREEYNSLKKILLIFGTRPEAIKMCPLISELRARSNVETVVCVTGQHREMLDSVLDAFSVTPDYDLALMREGQTLFDITAGALLAIRRVLELERPDLVLVHGDTSTTFASALAAFYLQIPVGHVEAGLRTYDIYSPYPEEFNRRATSVISMYNFAPTEAARLNLLAEGYSQSSIYVVGNTVIDSLKATVKDDYFHPYIEWASDSRLILLTAHRRESIGVPMRNIFRAVRRVVNEIEDIKVIYPIHLNPAVRKIVDVELSGCDRIRLTEPLDVIDFHNFLARCYMVLTDSGGIQEEAIFFHKPILLMRESTERPEGVEAGGVMLVGNEEEKIYRLIELLLDSDSLYQKMADAENPYGDGRASERIVRVFGCG